MKDGGICRFVPRVSHNLSFFICHWSFVIGYLVNVSQRLCGEVGWLGITKFLVVGRGARSMPDIRKNPRPMARPFNLVVAAAPSPTPGPAVRDAPRRNGVLTDTFCSRALRQARASLRIPRRPY